MTRGLDELYLVIKTLTLAIGSLLAFYVAPIPDLSKGFVLGALTIFFLTLAIHLLLPHSSIRNKDSVALIQLVDKTKHRKRMIRKEM